VGEIVAMGPEGASDWRGVPLDFGDRVTWSMVWSCGRCYYCGKGLHARCERLMKFGHEAIRPDWALSGGMAEHCHLPEGTAIFRVPRNVPDAAAGPSSCATATLAAVFRNAGPVAGEVVAIHGAGMLGLTGCAMAAAAGAAQVIAIEPDARRREQALRFGATAAIDSARAPAEIAAQVRELSGGRGADAGLELSGHPQSVELGIGLLRPGGRFLLAGATFPAPPVQLAAEDLVRRMIRISGVYNYAPQDLASALAFLASAVEEYPFTELVGATFPLREANEAMSFAAAERPPRVGLIP
jgi:alcohol dehydrogenase